MELFFVILFFFGVFVTCFNLFKETIKEGKKTLYNKKETSLKNEWEYIEEHFDNIPQEKLLEQLIDCGLQLTNNKKRKIRKLIIKQKIREKLRGKRRK